MTARQLQTLLCALLLVSSTQSLFAQTNREDSPAFAAQDSDPFLSSQDPCGRYHVGSVTYQHNAYFANVYPVCNGELSDSASVVIELQPIGSGWRFVNFHYPRSHTGLIEELKTLREQRRRQQPGGEVGGRSASANSASHGSTPTHCVPGKTDSAAAATVALDTLNKVLGFASEVHRFTRTSLGYTIVTTPIPVPNTRAPMAIIKLDKACRVTSLVVTDSA